MQIPLLNQFPQLPSFQQPTQQAPQEKLSKAEAREVKGFCPLCKCELWYDPSQTPVLCNVCDCEVVPVSSIGDRGFSDSEVGEGGGASVGFSAMGAAPIMGFDNPESALIYLENFTLIIVEVRVEKYVIIYSIVLS